MVRPYHLPLIVLAIGILISGCSQTAGTGNNNNSDLGNATVSLIPASYQRTIAQPEESSGMIRMDTDVYNIGEVVEFIITNTRNDDLSCSGSPPSFKVRYQSGSGQWITRMGDDNLSHDTVVKLKPGDSTAPYRFLTESWDSGRYRIVSSCGISREFILRAVPPLTITALPCTPQENSSPYIQINPISDQEPGVPFRISGTTNLPPGESIGYSLFAVISGVTNITSARLTSSSITVDAGECGVNSWSVEGVIKIPGDYIIGVSDREGQVSVVKRFTVMDEVITSKTTATPDQTHIPGITTDNPIP